MLDISLRSSISLPFGEPPWCSVPRMVPGRAPSPVLLAVAGCALPLKPEEEQSVLRTPGLTPPGANQAQIFTG